MAVIHDIALSRVLDWLGIVFTPFQWERMALLADWLQQEAEPAGGIGPGEGARIWTRHLADSVVFSVGITPGVTSVIDVGTGVGLPALPLAIARPDLRVVALDRSERRIDLLRRANRMLGLGNVEPRLADVASWAETHDAATFRGVGGVTTVIRWAHRVLAPGGVGIMGLSHMGAGSAPADDATMTFSVISVPRELLDSPVTLLRMERRVDL